MKKLFVYLSIVLLTLISGIANSQNQNLSFDGVDDWFVINPYQDLDLGTSDFTIEAIVALNQKNAGFQTVLTNNDLSGGGIY